MFGLEQESNNKDPKKFKFDIEMDLSNVNKRREFREQVLGRINRIQNMLREGAEQEKVDQLGTLLYGYLGMLKTVDTVEAGLQENL